MQNVHPLMTSTAIPIHKAAGTVPVQGNGAGFMAAYEEGSMPEVPEMQLIEELVVPTEDFVTDMTDDDEIAIPTPVGTKPTRAEASRDVPIRVSFAQTPREMPAKAPPEATPSDADDTPIRGTEVARQHVPEKVALPIIPTDAAPITPNPPRLPLAEERSAVSWPSTAPPVTNRESPVNPAPTVQVQAAQNAPPKLIPGTGDPSQTKPTDRPMRRATPIVAGQPAPIAQPILREKPGDSARTTPNNFREMPPEMHSPVPAKTTKPVGANAPKPEYPVLTANQRITPGIEHARPSPKLTLPMPPAAEGPHLGSEMAALRPRPTPETGPAVGLNGIPAKVAKVDKITTDKAALVVPKSSHADSPLPATPLPRIAAETAAMRGPVYSVHGTTASPEPALSERLQGRKPIRREAALSATPAPVATQPNTFVTTSPAAAIPPAMPAAAAPVMTSMTVPDGLGLEVLPSEPSSGPAFSSQELRVSSTSVTGAPLDGPRQMQLAKSISSQIAQVSTQTADSAIEVTLNPRELGRVRISMTPTETGMHILLQADRPEIIDLLRRNAETLAEEFSGAGYASISFAFDGGGQTPDDGGQDDSSKQSGNARTAALDLDPAMPSATPKRPGLSVNLTDSLDIRL